MFKGSDTKKEEAYANKSTTIEPFNDIIRQEIEQILEENVMKNDIWTGTHL